MSRRAAVVEEFDDDTDLPLPSRPLPNTGTRGAILEQLGDSGSDDDDGDDDDDEGSVPGPASPSLQQFRPGSGPTADGTKTVTDITPYKMYVCLLPPSLSASVLYTGSTSITPGRTALTPARNCL